MSETYEFEDLGDLPRSIGDDLRPLIAQEYEDLMTSMLANEELGERRLDAYLTLVAAITAAIGLASSRFEEDADPLIGIATIAAALMLLFGVMTLRRIVERNITTSSYKNGLRRIRALLIQDQPAIAAVFAFPPERKPVTRVKPGTKFGIGAGGLLETTAALNGALAAVVGGGTAWMVTEQLPVSFGASALTFALTWVGQLTWAHRLYEALTKEDTDERTKDLNAWHRWARSRDEQT